MDLLDDLQTQPVKARVFKKIVDIQVAQNKPEYALLDEVEQDMEAFPSLDTLNETENSLRSISLQSAPISAPSIGNLFGSGASLFEKVKRRLNGEPQEDDSENESEQATSDKVDTGKPSADNTEHTKVTTTIQSDHSSKTQILEAETQVVDTQIQTNERTQEDIDGIHLGDKTTQLISMEPNTLQRMTKSILEEDEKEASEEEDIVPTVSKKILNIFSDDEDGILSTEVQEFAVSGCIDESSELSAAKNNLFVDESDEDGLETTQKVDTQPKPLTVEEQRAVKQKRIEALVEKKKAERLLKQQQEKSKNDKDLSNSVEAKKQDDQNVAENDDDYYSSDDEDEPRRDESLNITANVVKKFVKTDLLAAFGFPKTGVYGPNDLLSSEKDHPTPSTTPANSSPVKHKTVTTIRKESEQHDDIELSDDSDSDFDVLNVLNQKSKQNNENVKLRLKEPANKPDVIELDDSEDSDDGIDLQVSKSTMLDIKAKFSKKTIESKRTKHQHGTLTKSQILEKLKNASKKQIMESRSLFPEDQEKIDMLQPQELDVESLLRRYVEHAKIVKDQERKKYKSTPIHESDDDDEYEHVPESDVPESEVEEEEEEAENENDEDTEAAIEAIESTQIKKATVDEEQTILKFKSRKRNVINDQDDEEDEVDELFSVLNKHEPDSNINLGSFGGNFSQNQNQTQKLKDMFGISFTQAFDDASQSPDVALRSGSGGIFSELRKNGQRVLSQDVSLTNVYLRDFSLDLNFETQEVKQVIYDDHDTQLREVNPPAAEAQYDSVNRQNIDSSPKDLELSQVSQATQDNLDSPIKTHYRKRLFRKSEAPDSEAESDEEEETQEDRLKRAEFYKEQRRKEIEEQKLLKEQMKSRGLDKIMEKEAEESEDEWFGVGGADGERSDEENSEDEKMFDDITEIKQDRSELAKKIAAEEAVTDQKMLMKILKDLETGNWKRRGDGDADGFDFLDEEDELMRRYRMYQQSKLREKFEEDEKLRQLARDKKSKAFFESIAEDSSTSRKDIFDRMESEESSPDDDEENPFVDKSAKDKLKCPEEVKHKKKIRITEAFVQKSLSFLTELDVIPQKNMNYLDEDDSFEDLHTLKQRSLIQLSDKTPQRKQVIDVDLSSSPTDVFKIPSLARRSFMHSEASIKSNEVTISTSYKAASSAKASIMSFGKAKAIAKVDVESHRVLKARKIEKKVKKTSGVLKSLAGSAFE
jgi:hypothetical protein